MKYNEDILMDIFKYPLTVITGLNGSGKTTMIKYIKMLFEEKYKNFDIISFPEKRRFLFSNDEIDSIDVLNNLNKFKINIKEYIKERYNIEDTFSLNNIKKDDIITCGYLQIINFFYKLFLHIESKDKIIIIDNFDLNLHHIITQQLLIDLMIIFQPKHIIITTLHIERYDNMFFNKRINIIKL